MEIKGVKVQECEAFHYLGSIIQRVVLLEMI